MAKIYAIAGLIINLVGVVILFRYGMPYRVESGGETALTISDIDEDGLRDDIRYRQLGRLGLFLIVLGTAFQIVAVL